MEDCSKGSGYLSVPCLHNLGPITVRRFHLSDVSGTTVVNNQNRGQDRRFLPSATIRSVLITIARVIL